MLFNPSVISERKSRAARALTPVIGDSMHASDFRDLILVAAIAVFVIPYQMLSERVRATFTE